MDMLKLLSQHEGTAQVALVIFSIGAAVHLAKQLQEFHDAIFTKRPLEKINQLLEGAPDPSPLRQFLLHFREQEIFRLCMRVRVSPGKAEMLMRIFATGRFSIDELRAVSPYLAPAKDARVKVEIGILEYLSLAWAVFTLAIFALLVIMFVLALTSRASHQEALGMLGPLLLYLLILFVAGRDGRAVMLAIGARKKLRTAGLLVGGI